MALQADHDGKRRPPLLRTKKVTTDDLAGLSPHLTPRVRDVLSVEGSMASRSAKGGTAPVRVAEQLEQVVATAAGHRAWAGVQPAVR